MEISFTLPLLFTSVLLLLLLLLLAYTHGDNYALGKFVLIASLSCTLLLPLLATAKKLTDLTRSTFS